MADGGWNDDIKESTMKAENNIDIEKTRVHLDCVKNEPNRERLDFQEDDYATQYRVTLKYENLFGDSTHYRIINEDYDNLIGFEDNDVIMENAMIKLEAIKEEYDWSFNNIYCSKCKGIYKGYCLKCSTLLHILNNNSIFENVKSEWSTIPKDILEIRETSMGKGVCLLRTLPKNVIFGPFEGILGIESTIGHSWKIIDNKLSNVEYANWMKNIVCAPNALLKNLDILQLDGNLYYRTTREITEGEELLIYYDDEKLLQMDNGEEYLYTPQKLEKLSQVFACTKCCFGFGSNKCLMAHKKKYCPMEYSKSMKDFVLVECHYCKMWMEKWEHEEYHVAQCLEKHHRMRRDEGDMDVEKMEDDCDTNDEETQCFSGANHDISFMEHSNNEEVHMRYKHTDDGSPKAYKCTECSYQTNHETYLQDHLNIHKGIKPFECDNCMKKFTRKSNLKIHIINKHAGDGSAKDYKCSECLYETNYKHYFQSHLNSHAGIKQFECGLCMRKFVQKSNLKNHIKNKHSGSEKDYKCSECLFQTNHKISLQNHLNMHRGIKPFECGICKMKFRQKEQLKIHVKNKHADNEDAKDYKCPECIFQTNYKSNFKKHINKHKGIKKFECEICLAKFTVKAGLKLHIRNVHADDGSAKDYKCTECPYQTNYKSHLQRHLNTHRGIKEYQCDICIKKFTRKDILSQHIKNKHSADGTEKDYKCSECLFQTNHKISLQNHVNIHRGIKPFECSCCEMKFRQKEQLKMHMKEKHADNESAKYYNCPECTYQTNYKPNFQKHINKHKGDKKYQCDICSTKFTLKAELKLHIRNVHADDGSAKDHKCPECPYQTDYKSHLQRHLNMHRGIKKYQCDICVKKFTRKDNLTEHIKNKHNGSEKNYKCPECPYQTNYKSHLQTHLNTHKGIKEYQCDICMKKFARKDNLTKHIKNQHNASEKDYKCSECPYQTNYKSDLQKHLNTHRRIKPFECGICKTKFGQKSNLKMHLKYKHADNGSEKDYKCAECPYQTNYKSVFQVHLNNHKGMEALQCHICMVKFTWKGSLTKHIKNKHNGSEKDYKCSECPYQTNHKISLQNHLNSHSGIKPFECDICKVKFGRKDRLKMHMKNKHAANGSAKDHKCPDCAYETNDKSNFRKHVNQHKGIKPYQCGICMKRFTEKGSLKNHIKNKHSASGNEKDYKCSECP